MPVAFNRYALLLLLAAACLVAAPAHANCTNPTAVESVLMYNSDYHTYQFCNGTTWIVAGGTTSPESHFQTFGDANIEAAVDSGNGNLLIGQQATLSYPATVTALNFHTYQVSGNLIMGIYDATGPSGGPGNLLATTAGFTPTDCGLLNVGCWNTASLVTPVTLAAGTYWLMYLPSSNGLSFLKENNTGPCKYYSYTYGALPSTYSTTPTDCAPTNWSFYGTLSSVSFVCSSPARKEGDIIYNTTSHTLQFCNGTAWISMGQGSGGGGGGCSSPAGVERDIIYNSGSHTYQFCNGTNWVKYGGKLWQGQQPGTAGTGYFVMSKSTWNGNLGDLTGADAKCLTELTTNTGWKGYAEANARGILTSGHVHAWLCGDNPGTCTNLNANTIYYFANANDSSLGGNRLTTTGGGGGPNDYTDWSTASYFGGSYSYWQNRGYGTDTAWGTSAFSGGADCGTGGNDDWTDSANDAQYGEIGTISSDKGLARWYSGDGPSCDALEHLICFVNP